MVGVKAYPPPNSPATSTQPAKTMTSARSLFRVIFSLNTIAEMTMIKMGEVYSSTTAMDA